MSSETMEELKELFNSIQLDNSDQKELELFCEKIEDNLEKLRSKNIEIENSDHIFKETVLNLDKLFIYILGDKNVD